LYETHGFHWHSYDSRKVLLADPGQHSPCSEQAPSHLDLGIHVVLPALCYGANGVERGTARISTLKVRRACSVTLPINVLCKPDRPCVPITSRSARSDETARDMTSAGSPSSTCTDHWPLSKPLAVRKAISSLRAFWRSTST